MKNENGNTPAVIQHLKYLVKTVAPSPPFFFFFQLVIVLVNTLHAALKFQYHILNKISFWSSHIM